jgi:hypothetical protein
MTQRVQIELTHQFAAPQSAVVATLEDAFYARSLAATHSFFSHIELLTLDVTAAHVRRTVLYRARPIVARLGPFSLPADWFTWIEHAELERATGLLRFENVPQRETVRDKVVNRGTMQFRSRTDECGRVNTVRESRFELGLHVARMYAPLAELALTMIASQVESSLQEEARFLESYLQAAPSLQLTG